MDEGNVGKRLEVDMKKDLLEKIRKLQQEKREEKNNENIDIEYFENCDLQIGKNKLKVSIAKINEKMLEKEKEEKTMVTFDIYMKYKGEDVLIASINEQGDLNINRELLEKIDPENELGLLELGEQEKPDLDKAIEGVEGKTEEKLGMKGKNGKNVDDSQDNKNKKIEKENSKPVLKKSGLKRVNLAPLMLINPNLKNDEDPCVAAYLDESSKSMVFEGESGEMHTADYYKFIEKTSESGNFSISEMNIDGKVEKINPSRVYTVKGRENYGISIDHENDKGNVLSLKMLVMDITNSHVNDYSVVSSVEDLKVSASGTIPTYRTQLQSGILEGKFTRGETDEVVEKYDAFSKKLASDVRDSFEEGIEETFDDEEPINDTNDLKKIIAEVLQEKYNKPKEQAWDFATRIVDDGDVELAEQILDKEREIEKEEEDPRLQRGHDARNW